jgi:hypothetical protein
MNNTTINFKELLEFDNIEKLYEFRFVRDDMLFYPFIRWGLFLAVLEQVNNFQQGHAPVGKMCLKDKCAYALRALLYNPFTVFRKFDILIFGSSAGLSSKKNGKWFDRINDYFVSAYPDDTLVVEQSYRGKFKLPRYAKHVRFLDYLILRASIKAKLFRTHSDKDRIRIEEFIAYIKGVFPYKLSEDYYNKAKDTLNWLSSHLPFLHANFTRMLNRVKPRIIFIEDASYGGKSYFLKWAKEYGIKTAEFQHGNIVPTHHAYNYGSAVLKNQDYIKHLPDYLLTYGAFFSECANTPSEKVVIGCPHFSANILDTRNESRMSSERIVLLIVSQGNITNLMVELTEKLAKRLSESKYNIIFRLHPGEVPFEERYSTLLRYPNVEISKTGDVYNLIRSANRIIGSSSTTLLEAIGFSKPVYIYESPDSLFSMPRSVGTWFRNIDELLNLLETSVCESPYDFSRFWEANWEFNYKHFIEKSIYSQEMAVSRSATEKK